MTILSRLQSVWQSLELREKLVRGKADVRMWEHGKVVILRRAADALDFRRRPRKSELHERTKYPDNIFELYVFCGDFPRSAKFTRAEQRSFSSLETLG